jgi:glycosyltransferase involved in cell wall biosynthesis
MLSVAIITHNEENNIKEALESVQWADEIVVVDAFSTDRTRDICREYTDNVFSHAWSGFSEQKNKAISLTTEPWVLVLDADERVTDKLRDEIISLLNNTPSHDGYFIPRKNYFGKRWIKHSGWWPDHTLRLFQREKGTFEPREVHEAIKINGSTGYLKNHLLHHTYRDIHDYLQRMKSYSTLSAKELAKNGRRATILDILFRPVATFFRMFVLQMGILDGFYGIILAYLYSLYTFKKYSTLRTIYKNDKSEIRNPKS